jgi:hypothetical protein
MDLSMLREKRIDIHPIDMGKAGTESVIRNNKTICVSFSQEIYCLNVTDAKDFRKCPDERAEWFPADILESILHALCLLMIHPEWLQNRK